jgi:hypothetical protein
MKTMVHVPPPRKYGGDTMGEEENHPFKRIIQVSSHPQHTFSISGAILNIPHKPGLQIPIFHNPGLRIKANLTVHYP